MNTICPRCKESLVLRTNRETQQKFWGCSGYPKCKFTKKLNPQGLTIYVLKQQSDKYYIGKSKRLEVRIRAHFEGQGCAWTQKYPPISVVEKIENCDPYDEDKITKKYMGMYGIDNVRGGSYSKICLTDMTKKQLQKEIWGANDQCFLCGGQHFAKDCTQNSTWQVWPKIKRWFGF